MQPNPSPQQFSGGEPQSGAPYEAALIRAFDKLTSPILIFLLGWGVVLIGLAVFKPDVSIQLLAPVYFLSALGVVTYIYQERRNAKVKLGQIVVRAKTIRDEAEVFGRSVRGGKGNIPDLSNSVDVRVGEATGRSKAYGENIDSTEDVRQALLLNNEEEYLISRFRRLREGDRRKLVNDTNKLLDSYEGESSSNA